MGLIFGLLKRLIKIFVYFLVFAAIVVFIPNLPPYTNFTSIELEPTQPMTGPLALNEALNNVEKAYVDKLLGPEAFQVYKGELYTSLATGEIVKVSPGGHVTFVTKLGQPCSGLVQEHICGRPLGFQIDENENVMYVSDAYHGIWKVDLKNDKKQLLVSPRVAIEGREPKLFNSIALSKNGDLYWTDSSSDFYLKDGAISVLTDPSGRLFHYDVAKNRSKVLLDNLWFANGIAISPDNQFVVVSETSRFRLMKYYIDGPKKGKSEVFIAGLPGLPDNVRALPDGSGLLVALYSAFDADNPLLTRSLAAAPLARKLVARMQRAVEIPFEYLNTFYPHVLFEDILYHIGHFKSVSALVPQMSGLLQVDWSGNVVAAYYNTDGSARHISDAIVFNGRLLTGNPHQQNFIGSLPAPPLLKKAFQTKPDSAPKQQAKPVEAPKPKAEDKPKVEVKREAEAPKPAQEKPKPVVQEKPKPVVQEKPKPVVQEKPKPVVQEKPKPVVQEKPVQRQTKPVEAAKPTPKPVEQPKPAQPKPTTPPPAKTKPPKAQTKQETKATPKPEAKTTPPPTPKPAPKATPPPAKPETKATPETKPAPAKPVKPVEAKPEKVKKPKESQKPVKEEPKPSSKLEQIPITEEIPSDTAKPTKETLKVIKKGGPVEIPNPNNL